MAVSFVNRGTEVTGSTAVTPGLPAGIAAGDILLAFVNHKSTTAPSTATAGWTLLATRNMPGSDGSLGLFYRVATGNASDLAPAFVTINSATAVVVAYRGALTTPFTGNDTSARDTATGASATSFTATTGGANSAITTTAATDWIVTAMGLNNDGFALTSPSIEFPSGTARATTRRTTDALQTATGTDNALSVQDCAAGVVGATQLVKLTGTLATASAGAVFAVVLRDASPPAATVLPPPALRRNVAVQRAAYY